MMKNVKNYKVHSLERGLDLMEILGGNAPEMSLTELSKAAGFNQTTAHRTLAALKARGYVRQNPANLKYQLSYKLFEIGNQVIRHLNLHEEALPILRELATTTGESIFLVILDGDEALCIENINAYKYVQVLFLRVGKRMPLHIGAAPRVLLAYQPEKRIQKIINKRQLPAWTPRSITDPDELKNNLNKIREQGYSLSVDDVTEGAAALGCPIFNWDGEVVASISISGASSHFSAGKLPGIIKMVKQAAYRISQRLHAPLDSSGLEKLLTAATDKS